MAYSDIRYELRGDAAWIVIDRPQVHNALRHRTVVEIAAAMRAADLDPVACVVLTGAGEEAFCAGGDVAEMAAFDATTGRAFIADFADMIRAVRGVGKPVIARIDGHCLGGGNELNISCDLSIATDRSVFGQVGARVGGVPVVGATELLPETVGQKRAREIVFLCQRYVAADAAAMGLVNRVVAPGDLDRVVAEWTSRIASLSPTALRLAKRSLNRDTEQLLPTDAHMDALASMFQTPEYREGMTSFLEKRRPNFKPFR